MELVTDVRFVGFTAVTIDSFTVLYVDDVRTSLEAHASNAL
jgi:hypothetical protein